MCKDLTKKYKTNYLTNVIFRIDYPEINLLKNEFPKEFYNYIKENFNIKPERTITTYQSKISLQNQSNTVEKDEQKLWDFLDSNGKIKVTLSSGYLVIETPEYISFEDFAEYISKIYSAFKSSYTEQPIKRLGLRYINLVKINEGSPLEWNNFIDTDLLGSLNWAKGRSVLDQITRGVSQIFLKDEDSSMTFTYGVYNSEFPAKISRKEFLLDYDCYTEEIQEGDLIKKYVSPFHFKINQMFEASIDNGLRNLMGVPNE